jgi:hypothetical protein
MDVGNVAFTECVKDIAYALRLFSFGPWCHTCWNEWNNIPHMWHCVRPRSQQLLYTRCDDHSCLSGKVALARWLYTYWNKERDVHTNCSMRVGFLPAKLTQKKPIFMFSSMEQNSNLPLVGYTTIYQLLIAYFQALYCNSFLKKHLTKTSHQHLAVLVVQSHGHHERLCFDPQEVWWGEFSTLPS